MAEHTYSVGPAIVQVSTTSPVVTAMLEAFYQRLPHSAPAPRWRIEAVHGSVPDGVAVNAWGVGHVSTPGEHVVRLYSTDPGHLAITTRKTVREAMIDDCEQRGYTMLHASAVADEDQVVIIVGDSGSGKTTLGLGAVLGRGMSLVSNDHLIVYRDEAGTLTLTSLPTLIPVRVGTYFDLEVHLPPPWDVNGVAVERLRQLTADQRYVSGQKMYYTFSSLGQPNPITVPLGERPGGRPVTIALARYRTGSSGPVSIDDPVAALLPHVRTDWMADPALNQRYLPRTERTPEVYSADAAALVAMLANRATVVGWHHRGDPTALLSYHLDPERNRS